MVQLYFDTYLTQHHYDFGVVDVIVAHAFSNEGPQHLAQRQPSRADVHLYIQLIWLNCAN